MTQFRFPICPLIFVHRFCLIINRKEITDQTIYLNIVMIWIIVYVHPGNNPLKQMGLKIYRVHQRTDKILHTMFADNGIHMVKSKVYEKIGIRLSLVWQPWD